MATQNAALILQLNTLLRLTAHEATTARARVAQATTDRTRRELTQNAHKCDERADAIRQAVRDLGGAPDVVGVALGKAAAAAKLPLEQALPVTEALLADLALEHQLFDRARLVKVLAHDADATDLVALAERLEEAHGNTIGWLFTVLSETALGGPAALAPSGVQTAAAAARHAATYAGAAAATGVNKAVVSAGTLTERVQQTSSSQVGRLRGLVTGARKVASAGRDATLAETEKQAGKEFGAEAARSVHQVRENLGVVAASDLPVKGFDGLTAKDAIEQVQQLRSVEEVRIVLAYEQAHKNRLGLVQAANRHVAERATKLVNS